MDFDTHIDRSANNTAKYTQCKAVFGRNDILPMWVADMDIISPPFILNAIQQRAQHPVFGYVDKPAAAIAAQITWLENRQNFKVDSDWVLSTHSIVAAIHMAIQAFSNMGDEVIIMAPVYHEFASSVNIENRKLINWQLESMDGCYQFSTDQLKKQISPKTKLLILCSPHNPIGRVWTREELKAIGEFGIENNIIIVADEMHADLIYSPHEFIPIATISDEIAAQCITLQGPGKTFNLTGLGLSSVIIGNPVLRKQFQKVHQQFHPSYGTSFSQVAFEAAYLHGGKWLDELLVYLNINQQTLQKMLLNHKNKITMTNSEATFLAWLDCSGLNMDSSGLKQFFVDKAGLGLSPGSQFGLGGEQYMRLNFAVPHSVMQRAVEQLDDALRGL